MGAGEKCRCFPSDGSYWLTSYSKSGPLRVRRPIWQVFEIVLGLVGSTFTNYTGNITNPVVEDAFAPHIWKP